MILHIQPKKYTFKYINIRHGAFQKCKKIAESKEEMAIAKPHVSDDEDDDRPFGGAALKENKGITFSLSVCMMHIDTEVLF